MIDNKETPDNILDAFDESIAESTKGAKPKHERGVSIKAPTNVSYMNKGNWKYNATIRNAYSWDKGTSNIWLGFNDKHECMVIISTKIDKKTIPVADITEGFETVDKICERY